MKAAVLPLPVVRACELDEAPSEQRWLIDSLWATQGAGVIGGSPKSLKSWLGLEMAVAVATGTPCLGRFGVSTKGPVLIYPAEDTQSDVKDRLTALCAHRDLTLASLDVHVITAPVLRLDLPSDQRRLSDAVAMLQPRMVLLDPFVRLHNSDENHVQEVAGILNALTELRRLQQTAVVLVHHTRKDSRARQAGQNLRGSSDLHAWGSSNLYITHERKRLKLSFEHRAAPTPEPIYIALNSDPLYLTIDEREPTTPLSLDERVLTALDESRKPITRTRLRTLLAVNNGRLGNTLEKLKRLGLIERSSTGWHR